MPPFNKQPGKGSSNYDATRVLKQDLGKPGKSTLLEDYAKHGGFCDEHPAADGCNVLDNIGRVRAMVALTARINDVAAQCRDAIRVVQFQTMLAKESELPWVVGVLLDVITGHVSSAIGGAIKGLRDRRIARLDEIALDAGVASQFDRGSPNLRAMLDGLSDKRIDATLKSATGVAKKAAEAKWKRAANLDETTAKQRKVDYLEALQGEMALGFAAIRERAFGEATDVEIFAMLDGFRLDNHMSPLYQTALRERLTQFEKLGLDKVGRHFTRSEDDHPLGGDHPIERDLRLVWVRSKSGRTPRYLAFQQSDGIRGGTLPESRAPPSSFGAEHPYGGPSLAGRAVPEAFRAIALQRHRDVWGGEPPEYVVDDALPRITLGDVPSATPAAPAAPVAPATTRAPAAPISLPPDFDLTKALQGVQDPR